MDIDYHRAIQGKIASEIDEGTTLEKAAKVRLDNLLAMSRVIHALSTNQKDLIV